MNYADSKEKSEWSEKEQEILAKVQKLIKKLDPSKENVSDPKNLEELLGQWEELEAENDKKMDAISRGIKK